ncbi:hypothetical protein ACPC54_23845 [Kitasatospora sp. NPDC094028]
MPRPLRHLDFRITLACGCTIRGRTPPLGRRVRYGCNTGLRHGHSLAWTSWTNTTTGDTGTNTITEETDAR